MITLIRRVFFMLVVKNYTLLLGSIVLNILILTWLIKNIDASFNFYIILILYISSILMLLFYFRLVSTPHKTFVASFKIKVISGAFIFIIFYQQDFTNIKLVLLNSLKRDFYLNNYLILILLTVTLLIYLLLVSCFIAKIKFIRQIN